MPHRYKAQLVARGALALILGYGVAATVQVLMARALPLALIDATIVATMLSFLVYAAAAVWSFAARSVFIAGVGLGAAALSCGLAGLLLR